MPNNLFLPFVVAPLNKKVVALNYSNLQKEYSLLYQKYPFLKAINNIQIGYFLENIASKDVLAPEIALHRKSVKQLKYMAGNYAILGKKNPRIL